ncbi:MAG: hypothetical protein IGS50_05615 [Synechococcales cyanobacterium C42_A2020_086]|nr:hypothetical protein [Synechococcales cyanobacterium M58_A2018_015]MBF2073226.1 hypothetical protein [Synechococcales cyanobacterium C42_A2020_086]
MLISASVYLPFPRPLVYATYRDKLPQLVNSMSTVKRLVLKSRQEQEGVVYQQYEWHGSGDIPAIMRAFLSEELLTWTDNAVWKTSDFTVHWTIHPHAFTEAVSWSGVDRFWEDGEGTRIETKGELKIDPHRLKGVPGFLSGQVSHLAEDLLGRQAEPNFVQMSRSVQSYLETVAN